MKYLLDAWLERFDPVVRLLDAGGGNVLAEWRGDAVRRLIADGVLELAEPGESALRLAGLGSGV